MNKITFAALAVAATAGCSTTGHVALLSNGPLETKDLASLNQKGPMLEGDSCGHIHSLSSAFRDALKGTQYDTLVNAEIETSTGIFVWSNCVMVQGRGLDSRTLTDKQPGGR